MHDLPCSIVYDDTEIYVPSKYNMPLDYTNHTDTQQVSLFAFDEGFGYTISIYENSNTDSSKISKWIFNLMCSNDHKKLK